MKLRWSQQKRIVTNVNKLIEATEEEGLLVQSKYLIV